MLKWMSISRLSSESIAMDVRLVTVRYAFSSSRNRVTMKKRQMREMAPPVRVPSRSSAETFL